MQKARRRGIISNIFDKWPGRKRFGPYRFIPIFFVLGAALEFSMIKWTVGETNFYRVYKRNQVEREARSIIEREKLNKALPRKLKMADSKHGSSRDDDCIRQILADDSDDDSSF